MRFLLTTQPAYGHFHPLVPVARVLEEAGHDVVFACARPFQTVVERSGFRCYAAGTDDFDVGRVRADAMVRDLLGICDREQPAMIVRDVTEFGGCLVAERFALPHASVEVGTYCPPAPPWDLIGWELSRLGRRLGLPAGPTFATLYRYLHLSFLSLSYQALGAFMPAVTRSVRPMLFDRSGGEGLPPWIGHLPSRPTVYATLGTVASRVPGLLDRVLDALRDEPINLILTVGHTIDPRTLGPLPEHVHIERYIPQSLLLPHCDVVVTHGGYNTVLGALTCGLPMVITPCIADQHENARRCEALGTAVVVKAPIDPLLLQKAVREVLHNPSYRDNARQLQAEIGTLPPLDMAVSLLEESVSRAASTSLT